MGEARVCLGAIAGAHGVRGLVRVKSFTEAPEDITAYGPLSDEVGGRHFALTVTGRAKGLLLAGELKAIPLGPGQEASLSLEPKWRVDVGSGPGRPCLARRSRAGGHPDLNQLTARVVR